MRRATAEGSGRHNGWSCSGERDCERRSAAWRAGHTDRAAVHLDEAFRQCQSEAGAGGVRAAGVKLFELVEDARLILATDADAVIDDFDPPPVIASAASHRDLHPLGRELVRVRQEI